MTDEIKRFKLREEKHVSNEITLMQWSPTMDLLALALASGEIVVNRLSWQRVWSYPTADDPPQDEDDFTVSAFAWRPDGKFLAVGYATGLFRLHDVENGLVFAGAGRKGEKITSLLWLEQSKEMCEGPKTYAPDSSFTYLPMELPQHMSEVETRMKVLVIGTAINKVYLYAFGFFHIGIVELPNDQALESQVVNTATLSPDLSRLSVVTTSVNHGGETSVQVHMFDTALLVRRHEEITLLSQKFGMIKEAKAQIKLQLQNMSEAWEEILRVMDSNLLKFAKAKKERNEGSISNDFLELLLFGTASLELRTFLVQELTAKGLEKLGYSIENSYSNIQKLVVRQLQKASQNLVSQLSDLHGMAQWYDKFGLLGLHPDNVQCALQSAAEFAVSAHEMQQVIDTSIKNFKAFFRWLYIAILRLSNETPPPEINKMTQHDIKFVADFLKDSFTNLLGDEDDEDRVEEMDMSTSESKHTKSKSRGFRLEKVGQYLDIKEDNLTQPPDYSENPWIQFLDSSSALKDSKVLYPRTMQGKSMYKRYNMFLLSYRSVEFPIAKTIGDSMKVVDSFQLFSFNKEESQKDPKVCQFIDDKTDMMWTVFVEQDASQEFLCLLRHPVKDTSCVEAVKLKIGVIGEVDMEDLTSDSPTCSRHLILDFDVFNPQTLTLMLKETSALPPPAEPSTSTSDSPPPAPPIEADVTLLVQLPLSCVDEASFVKLASASYSRESNLPPVDVAPLLPRASVSYQPNVVGHSLAVGGVRTTASMLLSSRRRIRLFLLEDDDEDEEGGTINDSSQQPEDGSTIEPSTEDGSGKPSTQEGGENKENSI